MVAARKKYLEWYLAREFRLDHDDWGVAEASRTTPKLQEEAEAGANGSSTP